MYPDGMVLTRNRSTTSSIDNPAFIHPEISASTCKGTAGLEILPLTVPSGKTVVILVLLLVRTIQGYIMYLQYSHLHNLTFRCQHVK